MCVQKLRAYVEHRVLIEHHCKNRSSGEYASTGPNTPEGLNANHHLSSASSAILPQPNRDVGAEIWEPRFLRV